jgi:hypothetical protein
MEFLEARRAAVDSDPPTADLSRLVGVAVSGGGIRSATFALGFFQALARHKVLRWVDYLSTVSGGSYFGGYLGGLFVPRDGGVTAATAVADVEALLANQNSVPNRWLRENGRYLAPAGGGDILIAGGAYLRSLVTIHAILGILVIGTVLGAFALRALEPLSWEPALAEWASHGVWPSPWLAVPLFVLVLFAIPLGWAFWLIPGQSIAPSVILPWLSIPGAIVLLLPGLSPRATWIGPPPIPLPTSLVPWEWYLRLVLISIPMLTLLFALLALSRGDWHSEHVGAVRGVARGKLSTWLSWALTVFGVFLTFALIDTAGQTLYAYLRHDTGKPWSLWTILPVGIASALPVLAKSAFTRLTSRDRSRPRVSLTLIANVAAVVILGVHLTLLATISHAIAWKFAVPANDPAARMLSASESGKCGVQLPDDRHVMVTGDPCVQPQPATPVPLNPTMACYGLLLALATSWLLGRIWAFLNLSTFQSLYAGRLTRAYLGASNLARGTQGGATSRLSDPVPGDDIARSDYRPFAHGGPLHLVNVTINETVTGETQTEYRDRKGIGLAVGPGGLSAGIRHHALWNDDPAAQTKGLLDSAWAWFKRKAATVAPTSEPILPILQPGRFEMWDGFRGAPRVEKLDMGSWIGISGAAFGTGLGYRTSVGLSLLAGFFNLRLGYWWNSYARPSNRKVVTPSGGIIDVGGWLTSAFSVQLYLLDEWLARFRGSGRQLWNLSDGGHFENTAGYELVRRRLPFMILLDDGEDPEWAFEDLGNLVRKARIDFGAQVEFVDPTAFAEVWAWVRDKFGADASRVLVKLPDLRQAVRGPLRIKTSKGHAALARITYDDSTDVSWLLVVKPTLTGDEPLDVLQYRKEHEAFPQEPTTEQFFDEAQWESYRRLGDHIGTCLFERRTTPESGPIRRPGRADLIEGVT